MRKLPSALALLLLTPAVAGATSFVTVPDGALVDQADVIARVRVGGGSGRTLGERIVTEYRVRVIEAIRGTAEETTLAIRVPGGEAPEGHRRWVLWGAPQLSEGASALVFLQRLDDDAYRILHFNQGIFHEAATAAGVLAVRHLSEVGPSDLAAPEPARRLDRFVAWIRDRQRGIARGADYRVGGTGRYTDAFTLLAPELPLRWFRKRLAWKRQGDGQTGLADGGQQAFRRARRAWNRVPGARIRLRDGGTTPSTGGFVRSDFRNTILFDDRNDVIGTDFDCDTGGVIAIGGVSVVLLGTRSWKGEPFFPIDEAEIVVNDGVECLFAGDPRAAEQVYAHELGHTLGLGHSCGDGQSPDCSASTVLDDALMRAFFHADGRAGDLGIDDVHGLRALYDRNFAAAPCDLPPGDPSFCRRCGPCGEGQGNCRRDTQCAADLLCERRVGEDFGFPASTNVCVAPE